jgi:hypothetical protein
MHTSGILHKRTQDVVPPDWFSLHHSQVAEACIPREKKVEQTMVIK